MSAENRWQAQEFVARAADIPPFPQSVMKLIELMRDPDASPSDVVAVVQGDAVLSAKLLKLCNSGTFGLVDKVSSVQHAVVFLGIDEVQRVAMALSTGGTLAKTLQHYALSGQDFWRHCLVTAHAAALLASSNDVLGITPSVAYTAGLLHDIGKLVLDRILTPEKRELIAQLSAGESLSRAEAERNVLGAGHAETGACLLTKWGLPTVLIEAVENHHTPICLPTPELSTIMLLADSLSYQMDRDVKDELPLRPNEREVASSLGLDSGDMAKALRSLQRRMEKLEKFAAL